MNGGVEVGATIFLSSALNGMRADADVEVR
jgi:hypothetical protein